MSAASSVIATIILAALAVFQVALAAGLPLGRMAWGGQHRILPVWLRVGSAISVVIYVAMAAILLDHAEQISVLDSEFSQIAAWVLVGYFAIGIAMNAMSRSKPERHLMTPVAAVLAVLSLVVAAGW